MATKPIIGVWYQPVSSFAKWKARGINALIGYENEGGAVTLDQYCDAALTAGLQVILQWSSTTSARATTDANVIAVINTPDEPDGAGNVDSATMIAQYTAIKAVTTKPVFINFDGWKMQYRPAADYAQYVQAGDWIAVDYYPVNRGMVNADPAIGPVVNDIPAIAARVKLLQSLVDPTRTGVEFFAFIETSDQNLRVQSWATQPDSTGTPPYARMRGPTAVEVNTELATVITAGAWPCYFPDVIGANFESFDGTPDDVAAVITAKNQAITQPPIPLQPITITINQTIGAQGYAQQRVTQTVTLTPN